MFVMHMYEIARGMMNRLDDSRAPQFLEKAVIRLPANAAFANELLPLLGRLGEMARDGFEFTRSSAAFYPRVALDLWSERPAPQVDFVLSDGETWTVTIENTTGLHKDNPYPYRHVSLGQVRERLAAAHAEIVGLDHAGFNLPWFAAGVHPRLAALREQLAPVSLYHGFPSGEPWDFILPATPAEIGRQVAVDYAAIRRPKFELVSFENASTPLVQLDVGVALPYEQTRALFPEALDDPALRNMWVYLESPYAIDVCLVLNEWTGESDWCDYFARTRM